MKISVLIPAFNCEATLQATLDSVMAQTQPADEVMVMDDGSSDGTRAIAQSYGPRVTVFWQPNGGVAQARNALIARATGDLVAFLDNDDIWHARYLETQQKLFEKCPHAVAFFTGHVDFFKGDTYQWKEDPFAAIQVTELISPVEFFRRYHAAPGGFGSASFCAIPMEVLKRLGNEPFKNPPTEDSYCFSMLSLLGSVVLLSAPLVAYRVRSDSLSTDQLRTYDVGVEVFEMLRERFRKAASPGHRIAFGMAFAAKRRSYAKLLMGVGKPNEARSQLCLSLRNSFIPISQVKSLIMLLVTCLPRRFQPAWPLSFRGVVGGAGMKRALNETPRRRKVKVPVE
jgi:glycosyltransferase involved in cell wall biosynthesis